jgi:hypothetical protein
VNEPPVWFRVWFPTEIVLTVGYLIVLQILNRRLRNYHAAQWNVLGQPSFLNNSPLNGVRVVRYFIFSDRYKQLGDTVIDRYAIIAKVLFAGCAVLFAIALLFFSVGAY